MRPNNQTLFAKVGTGLYTSSSYGMIPVWGAAMDGAHIALVAGWE